jgi:uncharacterized protein YgiM (DUF1202 family)
MAGRRHTRRIIVRAAIILGFLVLTLGVGGPLGPPPVGAKTFAIGSTVVVNTDGLNLRAAPGTDADVLLVLGQASVMKVTDGPVTADGHTWYKVDVWVESPVTGWVAGEYLLAMISAPTEYVPGSFPEQASVQVVTDLLNVRTGPGLDYPVIRQLPEETIFMIGRGPIEADGYSWYTLVIPDRPTAGWVAGEYLALVSDNGTDSGGAAFAAGDTAVIDAPALNCRTGPGLKYPVDHVMTAGETVTVLDGPVGADGYHWYKLEMANGDVVWAIGEGLI